MRLTRFAPRAPLPATATAANEPSSTYLPRLHCIRKTVLVLKAEPYEQVALELPSGFMSATNRQTNEQSRKQIKQTQLITAASCSVHRSLKLAHVLELNMTPSFKAVMFTDLGIIEATHCPTQAVLAASSYAKGVEVRAPCPRLQDCRAGHAR